MIATELLLAAGASLKTFPKGTLLFQEGAKARYYFQVHTGAVKMNNINADGKEHIQGIFEAGKSFGEPPLFGDFTYPANAEAISQTEVWQLPKTAFLAILTQHPELHSKFTSLLALRLYYKAMMVSEISMQEPEHRILRIIDYFKKENHPTTIDTPYKIPLTRQQLADLTGLRVETVIRTIKKLEKRKELIIKDRKVYR